MSATEAAMTSTIVLAGPTASGKSALALALAEQVGGELVCADSRQVYARMRIVSAGPRDDERARVPHHLFGEIDPREPLSAGSWMTRVDDLVGDIHARGRTAIVVGGTGMYLRAWRYGLSDAPPRDDVVRAQLDDECRTLGSRVLHARLAALDPEAAAAISPNDPVRVVRALEIVVVTGKTRAERPQVHGSGEVRVQARWLLLDGELDWLAPRMERRARAMVHEGLVDEAVALRAHLGPDDRLLDTLGVQEALAVHDGQCTINDAIERITIRTRQYARRQRTWWKKEPWWERLDATTTTLADLLRPPRA